MASWDGHFRGLVQWAFTDPDESKCCIVTAAHASGKTRCVPEGVLDVICEQGNGGAAILATNVVEKPRLVERHADVQEGWLDVVSYLDIADVWPMRSKYWNPVIVFIDVDPTFGSEFCLCLLHTLCQARSAKHPSRPLGRIVLLATSIDVRLQRMVEYFGMRMDTIALPDPWSSPVQQHLRENRDECIAAIVADLSHCETGSKHLVLSFGPSTDIDVDFIAGSINGHVEVLIGYEEAGFVPFGPTTMTAPAEVLDGKRLFCRILILPRGHCPGAYARGFDSVHVLTGVVRQESVRDYTTGLITTLTIVNTPEEMREQASWARRTDTAPERIKVWVETGIAPLSPRRRDKISNKELGGFLCLLAQHQDQGFDVATIARILTMDKSICDDMNNRLMSQGVFAASYELSTDPHVDTFIGLLPFLRFRYELALLVSLPTTNTLTAMYKVQWASLLLVGLEQVFELEDCEPTELHEFLAPGRPTSGRVTEQGTLWMCLAAWRYAHRMQSTMFMRTAEDAIIGGDGLMTLHAVFGQTVFERMKCLGAFLQGQGIVLDSVTTVPETHAEIPQEAMDELQRHLLQAFLYQWVIVDNRDNAPSLPFTMAYGCSSMEALLPNDEACRMVNLPMIRSQEESSLKYTSGISTSIRKRGDLLCIEDFTWIRPAIVEEWVRQHQPDGTRSSALAIAFTAPTDTESNWDEYIDEDADGEMDE